MLVKQIDAVRLQTLEGIFRNLPDMLGPAVERRVLLLDAVLVDVKAKLGRDHDLVPKRLDRLADDLFVLPRAVDLGRVKECHAPLVAARIKATPSSLGMPGPSP